MRIIMFISSYFPLYIMLLILYFEEYKDILFNFTIKKCIILSIIFLLVFISLFSIYLLKKSKSCRKITNNKVERPDDTIISYIMTYIIPLLSIDMSKNSTVLVNFILFLVIGYLYIRLNLVYLNPLWAIFGYLSYRFNDNKILITDINFNNLKLLEEINGYYLLNSIFVAQKKDNIL